MTIKYSTHSWDHTFKHKKFDISLKFSASHSRFVFSVIKKEACEVEHSYVSLSCSNGQLLNVGDATYGRLETNICSSDNFDETCSDNVLSVVSDRLWNFFWIEHKCVSGATHCRIVQFRLQMQTSETHVLVLEKDFMLNTLAQVKSE